MGWGQQIRLEIQLKIGKEFGEEHQMITAL